MSIGWYSRRESTTIHDNLLARAVVLELDDERIALVGCDLVSITPEITQRVRESVESKMGIPAQHVMVCVTHTHSSPAVYDITGWGAVDEEYLSDLHEKIASAVIEASGNIQPIKIAYGEAAIEEVARNREYEGGPIDDNVRVLNFTSDGEIVGFIAHYSVHPVVMYHIATEITGDLVGVAVNKVMDDHPGSVGIFLQGSCGDINPVFAHGDPDASLVKLDELSDVLADGIREALETASPIDVEQIAMDSRTIGLPQVPPDIATVVFMLRTAEGSLESTGIPEGVERRLRLEQDVARRVFDRFNSEPLTEWKTEIQVARLQDVLIVAHPGELFTHFAQQATDLLSEYKLLLTGYTNGLVGYIPNPDRYDAAEGNRLTYCSYFVPWILGEFRFREDVGDVLVQELVKLANDVVAPGDS